MRCNEFDTHIDEMLSGILHPEASQHMRQCERCASYFRARATVQNGLRKLATVSAGGPSRATDRAVMESYRRFQQRRAAQDAGEISATVVEPAHLLSFPGRTLAPVWATRTWWTGAAAAAMVFAVLGSTVHLWHGTPTVNAPVAVVAPAAQQPAAKPTQTQPTFSAKAAASSALRRITPRAAQPLQSAAPVETASAVSSPEPVLAAKAPVRRPVVFGGGPSAESAPVTEVAPNAGSVIRLASTGSTSNVAESASSTWPGYSNLMYCDPVVCSGPMQVVHIKVPVGQVKPNLGQTERNSFVNAEVVVGPDGVARAIRVAN
jgi:hypothetical protein